MNKAIWIRALTGALLALALAAGAPARAEEAVPQHGWTLRDGVSTSPRSDASVLDAISKDLHLDLSKGSDDGALKLPLAPSEWSLFKEVQPYAALSPSVVRSLMDSGAALASPSRETSDDPWRGLGVGAGVKWHLSDRLDLFGQYQFMNLPGANSPTSSPLLRRDIENPGLRGGLSIHF